MCNLQALFVYYMTVVIVRAIGCLAALEFAHAVIGYGPLDRVVVDVYVEDVRRLHRECSKNSHISVFAG